jgi:hypothetical protein
MNSPNMGKHIEAQRVKRSRVSMLNAFSQHHYGISRPPVSKSTTKLRTSQKQIPLAKPIENIGKEQ